PRRARAARHAGANRAVTSTTVHNPGRVPLRPSFEGHAPPVCPGNTQRRRRSEPYHPAQIGSAYRLGMSTGATPLSAHAPAPLAALPVTAFTAPDPEELGSCARVGRRCGMGAEEREIVARMQAGDREAFGEVYEQYAQRVFAFALRRLRDRDEAEDVCQDVFVEVARSIGSFQGRSKLGTWILGIAF